MPPATSCCLLLLLLIFGKVVVLSSPSSCLTKINVPCHMQEEEKNTDKQLWYQCRCSFLEVLQVPQRNCKQFICIDKWYPWQADCRYCGKDTRHQTLNSLIGTVIVVLNSYSSFTPNFHLFFISRYIMNKSWICWSHLRKT